MVHSLSFRGRQINIKKGTYKSLRQTLMCGILEKKGAGPRLSAILFWGLDDRSRDMKVLVRHHPDCIALIGWRNSTISYKKKICKCILITFILFSGNLFIHYIKLYLHIVFYIYIYPPQLSTDLSSAIRLLQTS